MRRLPESLSGHRAAPRSAMQLRQRRGDVSMAGLILVGILVGLLSGAFTALLGGGASAVLSAYSAGGSLSLAICGALSAFCRPGPIARVSGRAG